MIKTQTSTASAGAVIAEPLVNATMRILNEVRGRPLVLAVPLSLADFERVQFWAESEEKSVAAWCREVLLATCAGLEETQTFGRS